MIDHKIISTVILFLLRRKGNACFVLFFKVSEHDNILFIEENILSAQDTILSGQLISLSAKFIILFAQLNQTGLFYVT